MDRQVQVEGWRVDRVQWSGSTRVRDRRQVRHVRQYATLESCETRTVTASTDLFGIKAEQKLLSLHDVHGIAPLQDRQRGTNPRPPTSRRGGARIGTGSWTALYGTRKVSMLL